jgi:putative hemolysin
MNDLLTEILIIMGLILLNGFFASAEIAIIAMRRSRTKELIKKGNQKAKTVLFFQKNPEKFLATIQVGITLAGTFAAAYGGMSIVEKTAPFLKTLAIPFISDNATGISFFLIVILISFFSIIFGELVPKSLALNMAEKIALFVSFPIKFFYYVFFLFVKLLTVSSNLVLKLFGDKTSFSESKLSEEEIRYLILESKEAGTIETREHKFLENVFDFGDLEVSKVMVPHNKITAFDINDSPTKIINQLVKRNYSRIPIYDEERDNIIGILYSKDIMTKLARKQKVNIRELVRPPLFVPSTKRLHDLLQQFKKEKMHMAVVLDEHGGLDGIVTLEDILEELVGEISDESDAIQTEIQKLEDGTYLVEGSTTITYFNEVLKSSLPEDAQYNSISGFLLEQLRRIPKKGEKISYQNMQFTIAEASAKRIKKVTVKKGK